MATALRVVGEVEVEAKQKFFSEKDNKDCFMWKVQFLGGSKAFMVDKDTFDRCPESGAAKVSGTLLFGKDGKMNIRLDKVEALQARAA